MPTPDGHIGSRDLCTGAVVERTIADGGVSSLKISASLQSDNFASGSAGWQINRVTGSAEFQDATIRGTLNASDIVTGTLDASGGATITNINASNITTGTLDADRIATQSISPAKLDDGTTGSIVIRIGTGGRIESGDASTDVYIRGDGYARFKNIDVTDGVIAGEVISLGSITANQLNVSKLADISGQSGTINIDGSLQVTSGGSFKTGTSGQRIEITDSNPDRIWFPTGYDSTPGWIGAWVDVTTATLRLVSPDGAGHLYMNENGRIEIDADDRVITQVGLYSTAVRGGRFQDYSYSNGTMSIRLYNAGSASYPTYSFNGYTRTGMWNSLNSVRFSASGTERLCVDSTGIVVSGACDVSGYLYGNVIVADNEFQAPGTGTLTDPPYTFTDSGSSGMTWSGGFIYLVEAGSAVISGNGTSQTYLGGVGSGTGNAVYMNGTQMVQDTSSEAFKHDIEPAHLDEDAILGFAPVWFRYNDTPDRLNLGWTAEQVYDVAGDAYVHRNEEGRLSSIDRNAVATLMVEKIRQLDDRVRRLEEAML